MSVNRRIENLSLAALRMAASSSLSDPAVIAQWLYRFGTVPRDLAIERDFGPDDDPMAVLGMTIGGGARRRLEAAYEATSFSGWYSFARMASAAQLSPICKLYISPRPEALAYAFPLIADELVRIEVRSFKVGRGIEGLLRPDKIVAYFDERAHMLAAAAVLERALVQCPVQGVPFTADVGGNGLLSSGVDPPPGSVALSWRAWITKRLAASLAARVGEPADVRLAGTLADLRFARIDPDTWQPHDNVFRDEVIP